MLYRRLTKTVKDKGRLLPVDEVQKHITDLSADWYSSPYLYEKDALEYFKSNNGSLNSFKGKAYTYDLFWDIDAEGEFEKARENTVKLLEKIQQLGFLENARVFFSGFKGFHVLLYTLNEFTPIETANICFNLAKDAGVDLKTFDTSVYNITRIFRVENTINKKSDLFKIELTAEELDTITETELRSLAAQPRHLDITVNASREVKQALEVYNKVPEVPKTKLQMVYNADSDIPPPEELLAKVPKGKRKCIHLLENGYFGPGEREVACNYIASYHRYSGYDKEQSVAIIQTALEKRKRIFPEVKDCSEFEFIRPINSVYENSNYRGGIYKCHDMKIAKYCSAAGCDHKQTSKLMRAEDLCEMYMKYGNEAQAKYPTTGLKWIDERVRLRPRNFSIINGSNGSGKTSLAIQIMENLNKNEIYNIMFSMDMADSSLFEKLGARFTEYSQEEVEEAFNVHTRDEQIMNDVMRAIKQYLPYTIFDFTSAIKSDQIVETINNANAQFGIRIEVAFVDYAGKLSSDLENAYANSTYNAMMASDIAKKTNTHLLYLSQVSREQGDHTSPLRTSRVAKESGSWEENATCVINVWRPLADGANPEYDKYMHLYIGKNRSGKIEEGVFMWEGSKGSIRDISFQEYAEYRDICTQLNVKAPVMFREKLSNGDVIQKDRLEFRKGTDEVNPEKLRKFNN